MDILELAAAALKRPEYFAYYGGLDGSVWGRAFGVHRDSDALERSNWEIISTDLAKRFPDDWTDERSNHWAVGWCDEGRVKVLRDADTGITLENITEAFKAVCEWKERLDDYPVADESHYSNLEWEEFQQYVDSEASYVWGTVSDEDMPEEFPVMLLDRLSEDYSSVDDISGDAMETAAKEILDDLANPLNPLKRQAEDSARWRKHTLGEWNDAIDGKDSSAECIYCDLGVWVDTKPMPNGIDVSGSAVAIDCTYKGVKS